MKYIEFKKQLDEDIEYPVYLFEGEDAFFRERGFSLLKNKFVSNQELNFVVLENNCSVDEVLSSLNGYPFMSNKRLTLIREFYPKQDFFKKGFNDYLDNPNEYGVLVILNEKQTDFFKGKKNACTVDCSHADISILIKWVKAECITNQVQIDGESATMLCEFCLLDMTRIENETKKLCAFVGENGVIDKEIINQMVARDTEYKVYQMTDYISQKQFDLAFLVIKDMLNKGETEQRILTAVYNYYRRLLHASISDMKESELAKAFGIMEFAAKKIKAQSAKFTKRSLKKAVDYLVDMDYKIKSGLANQDEGMWQTVFKIMLDK